MGSWLATLPCVVAASEADPDTRADDELARDAS